MTTRMKEGSYNLAFWSGYYDRRIETTFQQKLMHKDNSE